MHLVLIETSGNQAYIFATNKLSENVGASELTVQVGTQWVLDAVRQVGGKVPPDPADPEGYPPLNAENPVEVILAVSGKALLLVREAEIGRRIVRAVTLRALKEAPGLEVQGVVAGPFDFDQSQLHQMIREAHRQLEAVRSRLPGTSARFAQLPIFAACASSGAPAARYDTSRAEKDLRSAAACAKYEAARAGWNRICTLVGQAHQLPRSTTEIEDLGCDWLAIIHADGNGLGRVFLDFAARCGASGNRDYLTKLRNFSYALDACTQKAFRQALDVLRLRPDDHQQDKHRQGPFKPVVPLVLGGDDLTVVCDGRQALQFSKKFLDHFEEATRQHPAIRSILPDGVTACAGVAIVKPHFPFFAGYQLAEHLLQSAKKIAKDSSRYVSALDFHILYDASGPDLDRIRRALTVDNGQTLLVGRPYVTTPGQGPPHRRWSDLADRIAAVRARDEDGRRRLPNSMLHELREGLFLGREAADARLRLVLNRYRQDGLDRLLGAASGDGSLFWREGEDFRTALLDAVDTADFWEALA